MGEYSVGFLRATIPFYANTGPPRPYLIRHEIIAMHSKGFPQVYPYCFQAE